jgi:CheY-like chemotaxis protein
MGEPIAAANAAGTLDSPSDVLVVDDVDAIRHLVVLCLQDAGYRVASAANGKEALALLGPCRPRLVLSICTCPSSTGAALRATRGVPAALPGW